jgi:hypothetical protein
MVSKEIFVNFHCQQIFPLAVCKSPEWINNPFLMETMMLETCMIYIIEHNPENNPAKNLKQHVWSRVWTGQEASFVDR